MMEKSSALKTNLQRKVSYHVYHATFTSYVLQVATFNLHNVLLMFFIATIIESSVCKAISNDQPGNNCKVVNMRSRFKTTQL